MTSRFRLLEDAGRRRLNASANPPFVIIAFLLPAVLVSLSVAVLGAVSLDPVSETFPVEEKRKERKDKREASPICWIDDSQPRRIFLRVPGENTTRGRIVV